MTGANPCRRIVKMEREVEGYACASVIAAASLVAEHGTQRIKMYNKWGEEWLKKNYLGNFATTQKEFTM